MRKKILSSIFNSKWDRELLIFSYYQPKHVPHLLNRYCLAQYHPVLSLWHSSKHYFMSTHKSCVQNFINHVISWTTSIKNLSWYLCNKILCYCFTLGCLLNGRVWVSIESILIFNLFRKTIFIKHVHSQKVNYSLFPRERFMRVY